MTDMFRQQPIEIGTRREVFWDDTMINRDISDTLTTLHHPERRELILKCDNAWGGDDATYMNVIDDNGLKRLYYGVYRSPWCPGGKLETNYECYAESTDGIHWETPELGLIEFNGSKRNNIVWTDVDGFRVIRDTNPKCKSEEKYKALLDVADGHKRRLCLFTSPDGLKWEKRHLLNIVDETSFDSMNTLLYNERTGHYECFMRGFHMTRDPQSRHMIRGICMSTSEDLIHWSYPVHLQYDPFFDWQMYTNGIMHYYRAEHIYVGFPTRYVERKSGWTTNYDELCGREKRLERLKDPQPRIATAVTDAVFMTSRNGLNWSRFGDAFLRPGPEYPNNWVYGSVYLSSGMVETPSTHPGCEPEISMYSAENRWSGEPAAIYRYSIRRDGFASQFGSWRGARMYTRPFILRGRELRINFATSAAGAVKIRMIKADGSDLDADTMDTDEMFGDSTERRVHFTTGEIDKFIGQPVVLRFDLWDADVYSFKFS
jgi:hypothetical protein